MVCRLCWVAVLWILVDGWPTFLHIFFSSQICGFEWSVCWLCANTVVVWVVSGLVVGWFFMIWWWLLVFDGL